MNLPTAGPADIARAVELLRRGGLVAFPTETVYGLGADARNPDAVGRIFRVKGRPASHPLIVHLADGSQIEAWAATVSREARLLAEAFWPGPLTLILPRRPDVPDVVTAGQDTVGLRVPAHPVAQALLTAFAGGIAAPSANRFGRLSPTRAEHVRADLGDAVDLVLEGGPSRVGIESTIVDVSAGTPVVLRPGHITTRMLSDVLGVHVEVKVLARAPGFDDEAPTGVAQPTVAAAGTGAEAERIPRAPGTLAAHYAPETPLELLDAATLARRLAEAPEVVRYAVVWLGSRAHEAAADERHVVVPLSRDPEAVARDLYATLRRLDAAGVTRILVEEPPPGAEWEAVRDRLRRAAATFRQPPPSTEDA